jgi:hypothetical protein
MAADPLLVGVVLALAALIAPLPPSGFAPCPATVLAVD